MQKEQIVKTREGWLIQFNLINGREEDHTYKIIEEPDWGDSFQESVRIPGGGIYVYTHHIYAEDVNGGKVNFTIYREPETAPVETLTYYLYDCL
ncbi:MAG: hypothetical protein M1609_08800 [Firmicutes bacterium]|nr:hypothetical protein [Bacillota bacterium]